MLGSGGLVEMDGEASKGRQSLGSDNRFVKSRVCDVHNLQQVKILYYMSLIGKLIVSAYVDLCGTHT